MQRYFIIRTDHKSLKFLLEQELSTLAQQAWLTKLQHLDYVPEDLFATTKGSWQTDSSLQRIIQEL